MQYAHGHARSSVQHRSGPAAAGRASWLGRVGAAFPAALLLMLGMTAAMAQETSATRSDTAGQVTITVTWQELGIGLIFRVVMDSHTVDLDAYDLQQLAVLRTDQGREVTPIAWDAPAGGHHREGTLTFPTATTAGELVIDADTRVVELIIRDVAGVPVRTFQWPV